MTNGEDVRDYRKLGELLKECVNRVVDCWEAGEGDLILEIRDGDGKKNARIKGGPTSRIR